MWLPIYAVAGDNFYALLALSPLIGVVAAAIAPDVFLRGEYPRMRRRR